MKYYSILLLLFIVIFSSVNAGEIENCSDWSADQCLKKTKTCQVLTFISCCGNQENFCVSKFNCSEEISCGEKDGEIFEFWSSCTPKGFSPVKLPNDTCESLGCPNDCEWVNSDKCLGTACCPRVPRCKGQTTAQTSGQTGTSGSSGTTSAPTTGGSTTSAHSCDNYKCPKEQFCILQNGSPVCIDGSSSGQTSTSGSSGQTATSGSTGNSCSNVQCPNGQHCILDNGTPKCIVTNTGSATSGGNVNPCQYVRCPDRQACIVNNGSPKCIYQRPKDPCDGVKCSHGKTCKSKGEKAFCTDKTCSDMHCPHGTKCFLNNGTPKCIVISPSTTSGGHEGKCKHIQCPRGKECKEENGIPHCADIDPCDHVVCSHQMTCVNYRGRPACERSTCSNFKCPNHYKCVMEKGLPNCLPRGAFIPDDRDCESIDSASDCISNRRCALQSIKSCCGNEKQICVNRPNGGCRPDSSDQCVISRDGQIYHLDNTCKPTKGFTPYIPPQSNNTCESLNCGSRGLACLKVKSSACVSEPCCPTVAICSPYHISAGSTVASTTATTASTTASTIAQIVTAAATTRSGSTVGGSTTSNVPAACLTMQCPEDEVCCQPNPALAARCVNKCELANCAAGTRCVMSNGIPTCVASRKDFSWLDPSSWNFSK